MVFEVKEFNDVTRFNIGRIEDKMSVNMAEISHLNVHNSLSMGTRYINVMSLYDLLGRGMQ